MVVLGRKWIAAIAVCVLYSALVLVWMPWEFKTPSRPPHGGSCPPSDVVELRHHSDNLRDSSRYNPATHCKEFLQEGGAADPAEYLMTNADTREQLDRLEWSGGEWFYPLESSNPNWSPQHNGGYHDATFLVYPTAMDVGVGVEWENLTHSIQIIGGYLILKDLWERERCTVPEFSSKSTPAFDLKLLLLGAFTNTGVDRRVCMTGCAHFSAYANQPGNCAFVLKMKYPNHPTLEIRRVEAELSSARRLDDPLHFPAFRIVGPSSPTSPSTGTESEYEYRLEKSIHVALNMSSIHNSSNGPGISGRPEDLATYLEGCGAMHRVVIAPTVNEKILFQRHRKVVVGPFSAPYDKLGEESYAPDPEPDDLSQIELTLQFNNLVTRASNLNGRVNIFKNYKF